MPSWPVQFSANASATSSSTGGGEEPPPGDLELIFVEFSPTSNDPVFDVIASPTDIVVGAAVIIYRDAVSTADVTITQTHLDTGEMDLSLLNEPAGQHDYTAQIRSPGAVLGDLSNVVTITVV